MEEINSFKREKQAIQRINEACSYDIIGDVHGCYPELLLLLNALDYTVLEMPDGINIQTPSQRKLIFVGDLTDRGPDSPAVMRLVMAACKQGVAYCVCGNHDDKLCRFLKGNKVKLVHGLEVTAEQLADKSDEFKAAAFAFFNYLPTHIIFDNGNLLVAHAGLRAELHGKTGGYVWQACLYGENTGKNDEDGLPQRLNWTLDYESDTLVVYGHTPILEATWSNNTINIDTGCTFGGKLTALRYPERELISIAAFAKYAEPRRPLGRLEDRLVG
jgi:diadenosine tetraphosphatase ApaH/serine/threonine PP2A family protein phosphatase